MQWGSYHKNNGDPNGQTIIDGDFPILQNCFNMVWESRRYWLVVSTPLKNMKVNWDDYSKYMGKLKMFQTTNQHNMKPATLALGPCTNLTSKMDVTKIIKDQTQHPAAHGAGPALSATCPRRLGSLGIPSSPA